VKGRKIGLMLKRLKPSNSKANLIKIGRLSNKKTKEDGNNLKILRLNKRRNKLLQRNLKKKTRG